ncbi:hypothetical protein LA080_011817 [Diaporthe eres]|nr:hypothetical protein LA080_011817 [Diaporthe eres]
MWGIPIRNSIAAGQQGRTPPATSRGAPTRAWEGLGAMAGKQREAHLNLIHKTPFSILTKEQREADILIRKKPSSILTTFQEPSDHHFSTDRQDGITVLAA